MINLIPKEEKKRMATDLYYRLLVLFFIMLNLCFVVAITGLIPSYIFSSIKLSSVAAKLETQKAEPIPLLDQEIVTTIKGINSKLDVIEAAEKNKFSVSIQVINAIVSNKRSDMKINHIAYNDDPISGRKVTIDGIAPSREVLLLFRQTLEENPLFKKVDLPISNFVKGSNISFQLSLTPV